MEGESSASLQAGWELQGLKPARFGAVDVAPEGATHKDSRDLSA